MNLRLAAALYWFWDIRGFYGLGRQMTLQALNKDSERAATKARADALHYAAFFVDLMGEKDSARELYEQSLRLSEELCNQRGIASSLFQLGVAAHAEGDRSRAESLLLRSLEILRDQKSGMAALSLTALGLLAKDRGDYERAQSHFDESLNISRELKLFNGLFYALFSTARLGQGPR